MAIRTDSCIVEYNEDGSQTITSVEHYIPPTKSQQIAATTVLGLIVLSPAIFLGAVAWYEDRQEKRAAKKNSLKSV